jgi:CBS domain-containing protein
LTDGQPPRRKEENTTMKVSDILRVKGNTLYTITPEDRWPDAVRIMAEKDIGSLVVMEHGRPGGHADLPRGDPDHGQERRQLSAPPGARAMDDAPLTCTLETELDEVRRMMLERHAATCRSWTNAC